MESNHKNRNKPNTYFIYYNNNINYNCKYFNDTNRSDRTVVYFRKPFVSLQCIAYYFEMLIPDVSVFIFLIINLEIAFVFFSLEC